MSVQLPKRNRFLVDFHIFNKWLSLKQRGLSLSTYFIDNDIKTIAIYAIGSMGERLFNELKDSPIQVLYAIDRDTEKKSFHELPLYNLTTSALPKADVIVATVASAYWEITEDLKKLTDLPVLSIEDIVQYCYDHYTE